LISGSPQKKKGQKKLNGRITPRQRFSASDAAGIHVAIRAHWMNKAPTSNYYTRQSACTEFHREINSYVT